MTTISAKEALTERIADRALVIAGKTFRSRLFLGSGKFRSFDEMKEAYRASETEMVTVAVRRLPLDKPGEPNLLDHVDVSTIALLPNTAGAYTVDEAIRIAHLGRAACGTNWVKLEVIGDPKYLLPDPVATIEAAKILVGEGFIVLPYTNDDPFVAKRLQDVGCATVMPGGSPIGSGQGVPNFSRIKIMKQHVTVPIVVDSGLGTPSDAAIAMEAGADAVLVNTAIAEAQDPAMMADGFKRAVEAGRLGYLAGRMPVREYAAASSPIQGLVK